MTPIKISRKLLLFTLLPLAFAPSLGAQAVNGNFDSGDFTGWTADRELGHRQ